MSRHSTFVSRQSTFVSRQSSVKARSFYVAIEFGLGHGSYVATKCFYVTTKFSLDMRY